jgi:predicted NACHT family NTPase
MFEWLAASASVKIGELVLEQVLKLGQAAAEDYVKDFFKNCLQEGIMATKPGVAKKAVTEALKAFLLLVTDELEDTGLSKAEIRDRHYEEALIQFIKNDSVKPLLGKAFEQDCKAIDTTALVTIWQHSTLRSSSFPAMPEGFDWQRIGGEYLRKVRRMIRETPELRSLLETELSEQTAASTQATAEAARQIAGRSVPFDLTRYREAILEQYEFLQLESLGSSKYEQEGVNYRAVPLWGVFVAQNVRECQDYLPQIHETPKEQLRRLHQAGDMEAITELEAESRRERYTQKPAPSVQKIVGLQGVPDFAPASAHPYIVILGDPGSGKSTLLRYLVVKWAQQPTTEQVPLLIELRRYIQSKQDNECQDFVEFVHKGSNWVNHLDQQRLDDWLQQGKVLVLLDGLDEVVDQQQRGKVLKQIHSFTQRYAQVSVIVTSRVIGYNAQPLRDAGFYHYMLQDLNREQIEDFIQRWHDLTYSNAADKQHKRKRLKTAIQNSKAIQELAENPLLLTLMAILNRGEELPRDRARLYEKASEVLLYQWDVEAKLLEDPRLKKYAVEIDFRDKQAMLRRVAYAMQASEKGLAGNFILREDLQSCLTNYLKENKEAQSVPSIAMVMIAQLRERNFALCSLGDEAYGFIHRTFLEYFCASEMVHQFEKQRILSFEQLRDHVFGQHWQDETWHEVLRLICGMVDASIAGQLIEFLIAQKCKQVPSGKPGLGL